MKPCLVADILIGACDANHHNVQQLCKMKLRGWSKLTTDTIDMNSFALTEH